MLKSRLLGVVGIVAVVIGGGALFASSVQSTPKVTGDTVQIPGYTFPYRVDLSCPSEDCVLGLWLACANTPVREKPGKSQPVLGQIPRDGRFTVVGGALLSIEPGIVRVTSDVHQRVDGVEHVYKTGDTLFLLGHVGVGWFAAVHNGQPADVEIFWPWQHAGGFPIAGDLIRDATTELWMQTSINRQSGWLLDDAGVISPYGRVEPLRCPTRD
jgi:hypothetical protein